RRGDVHQAAQRRVQQLAEGDLAVVVRVVDGGAQLGVELNGAAADVRLQEAEVEARVDGGGGDVRGQHPRAPAHAEAGERGSTPGPRLTPKVPSKLALALTVTEGPAWSCRPSAAASAPRSIGTLSERSKSRERV